MLEEKLREDVIEEKPSGLTSYRETVRGWIAGMSLLRLRLIAIVWLIFISLVVGLWVGGGAQRRRQSMLPLSPDYLSVLSVNPTSRVTNLYAPIYFRFNLPVEAHHLVEFVEITPHVEGIFSQGPGREVVYFSPSQPFTPGARVVVRVKAGLPSDTGKKLQQDYTFSFAVEEESRSITFLNKNLDAKFMSFVADKGAELTVNLGGAIKKPQIKIYRAPVEMLLQSLSYTPSKYDTYGPYGTYNETAIDTTRLELVKQFDDVVSQPKIQFKGAPGLYLFEAREEDVVVSTVWVTLNTVGIHLRQDDQKVILAAQDFVSGQAVGGIGIDFYNLGTAPKLLATHTLGNIQEYPFDVEKRLDLVIGRKNDEVLVLPVSVPNSQAEIRATRDLSSKQRVFIYTDRPIYKKGDTVFYRGLVRTDNDALYQVPPAGTKIRVFTPENRNAEKKLFVDQTMELKNGGIFAGQFVLPVDFSPGTTYLYATTDVESQQNYGEYATYFDVAEYVKPEFGLDISVNAPEQIKQDLITATIAGTYFDGRALAGEKVTYAVYQRDYYETEKAVYSSSFNLNSWGGMCGGGFGLGDEYYGELVGEEKEIILDAKGNAVMSFATADVRSAISQELIFVVSKVDANQNKIVSAKTAIVHAGEFNVFFRPGPAGVASGQSFEALFYAESLQGEKLAGKTFTYSLYEDRYDYSTRQSNKIVVKEGDVTLDENGVGRISDSHTVSESRGFYLEVAAKDGRGNTVTARKYIYFYVDSPETTRPYGFLTGFNSQPILKVTSSVANIRPGTMATLNIDAPTDMRVLMTFERGRVYAPQWLELKKGKNDFVFEVEDDFVPSITPTFGIFYNGEAYLEGLSLNVPALHKVVTVEIATDKAAYNPGDTALITLTTKDAAASLISARVGLGIVDKAIYALRKSATPPLHSSFYFFRPRQTNASSSLTWIGLFQDGGRGGGGGGSELFSKDVDTLYWNPDLITGSDGRVTIEVPVGNTQTVWRAVAYATTDDSKLGQGELDFQVAR